MFDTSAIKDWISGLQQKISARFQSKDAGAGAESATAEEAAPQSLWEEVKELATVVVVAFFLMMVMRTFLFQPFTIPSASMEPNLYEGDYIIVSKWNYGYSKYSSLVTLPFIKGRVMAGEVKRGDIVVFKLPVDNKTDYIKRVVGLPGDRIQVKDSKLYINDLMVPVTEQGMVTLPKDRAARMDESPALLEETFEGKTHKVQNLTDVGEGDNTNVYIVPEGHYFMMGDNRDNSLDSRWPKDNFPMAGVDFVPAENIEGKANIILMSWKDGASIWKPWTWFNLRWDRFFKSLS